MKLSVIIPVYGVEKYLEQCVESILNTQYTDMEIILVDDGSPDKCPAICDDFAERDARVKVIHKDNGTKLERRFLKNELKSTAPICKYANSSKTKMAYRVYKVLGYTLTCWILSRYLALKNRKNLNKIQVIK